MSNQLWDHAGYEKHREAVDVAALELGARGDGLEMGDLYLPLYELKVGDARSKNGLEISYSSTGAIARAAVKVLVQEGWLERRMNRTGKMHNLRGREVMGLRIYYVTSPRGAMKLRELREAIEARDRSEAWQ